MFSSVGFVRRLESRRWFRKVRLGQQSYSIWSNPNHETHSTDIAFDAHERILSLSYQIWEVCLRVSLSVFCSVFTMKRRRNALDEGQQTPFFQAPQGDIGRLTRTRSVQLAQPSMEAGSTGNFFIDEPRYFVKNQDSNFLFVSSLTMKPRQHPLPFSIILSHTSMCFVRSLVKAGFSGPMGGW